MITLAKFVSDVIREAFRSGYRKGERKVAPPGFTYSVGPVTNKKPMPLDVKLTTDQQVTVHINPATTRGKPAPLDGIPEWSVVAGDAKISPSADGYSCLIVSPDDPGDSQVMVQADADLGEGKLEISDIISVRVSGANAAVFGLTQDPPEDKPAA